MEGPTSREAFSAPSHALRRRPIRFSFSIAYPGPVLLFFTEALPADTSDLGLEVAGYTSETVYHAPRNRAYKSLHALLTAALSAGSATVTVRKNGVSVGSATITSSAHRAHTSLALNVVAGDRLEVKVSTTADLAPTTTDLLVLIQ